MGCLQIRGSEPLHEHHGKDRCTPRPMIGPLAATHVMDINLMYKETSMAGELYVESISSSDVDNVVRCGGELIESVFHSYKSDLAVLYSQG
ncbi:hypothetical protein D3C87_1834980 [compost metagenome]